MGSIASSSEPGIDGIEDNDECKPCDCDPSHHRAFKAEIINVPQRYGNPDGYLSNITAYFSHAFLHWLVEVNFKCNNCGRKFMCTMDFDVGGKHWYWNKVSDNRPIKYSAGIDRPLEYVEHQYGEMQGDGYSIISFNCIHWAKDFYSRLTGEPLTGDPSS
ncbi:hypothetical protein DdX_06998 [Ditylenchus destructor]|uniref:PPPDE domain-containing protein n=1 Tax=Ditylenchus destructor TaxID=166010 RepID=A0AAD4N9H5_9BILA|nr:hypothetical protein DdX_06998 [Ditylenchus destructor]